MSYCIYDSSGYVGDLASTSGLKELMDYLSSYGGANLKELAENGCVETSDELTAELKQLPDDPFFNNFKELVEKSKDIVIINDGLFEEEK